MAKFSLAEVVVELLDEGPAEVDVVFPKSIFGLQCRFCVDLYTKNTISSFDLIWYNNSIETLISDSICGVHLNCASTRTVTA